MKKKKEKAITKIFREVFMFGQLNLNQYILFYSINEKNSIQVVFFTVVCINPHVGEFFSFPLSIFILIFNFYFLVSKYFLFYILEH